jgi:hypothetical protein
MINGVPSAALPSAGGHADHPDLRQARAIPSRLAQHAERRLLALGVGQVESLTVM